MNPGVLIHDHTMPVTPIPRTEQTDKEYDSLLFEPTHTGAREEGGLH